MILVFTTYPDIVASEKAAKKIIEEELAACVNIIKIEKSIYRWKGEIKEGEEFLLIIKTTKKAYRQLEHTIKDGHPYELCEIIWFEIKAEEDYYRWVTSSTLTKLLRVPLDLSALKRKEESAKNPRTFS